METEEIQVQVVDEVYDEAAAAAFEVPLGTVCVMIHTGSRGFGHQDGVLVTRQDRLEELPCVIVILDDQDIVVFRHA
jgi:RNA-splicing ligase RtcB